ncbi:MAG: hypothetical protein LBS36_02270 [Oscillospiraceae bacterium]|jgi:hypothetical protein|nr:hypothetical protein [Oscillospiraceae bacterium]
MSIVNLIVKIITFFGSAFRATVEQLACRGRRLIVEDVSYFSPGKLCGHVAHEMPRTKREARVLCVRPFFVNLILGLIILAPASFSLFFLENYKITIFILYWIGISLWTNLFPSHIDAHVYQSYAQASHMRGSKFMSSLFGFGAKIESTGVTLLTSIAASFVLAQITRLILPLFYDLVQNSGV